MKQVAVLRNPALTGGIGQFAIIQYVASLVGVEVSPVDLRDTEVIEPAVTSLGRAGNSGLIVTADGLSVRHRELIIRLAALHKLPAVYSRRLFVADGGLISTVPIGSTFSGRRQAILIAFSRARSRLIFRSCSRLN